MSNKKVTNANQPWTEQHQARYNGLYSRFIENFPKAKKETYIDKYSKSKTTGLFHWLEHKSNYALGSQKNMYFMIGRFLQIKNNPKYEMFLKRGAELKERIAKEEAKNLKSDKEILSYRPFSYFENIVDESRLTYHYMTYKQHMTYLLLALNVLQPPVRTDFYVSCRFITDIKKNKKGEFNYLFIDQENDKMYYIINDDKVSTSKYYSMRPQLSKIEIEDDFLKELILYSYENFYRTFLLQSNYVDDIDETIMQGTYLAWLRKITVIPTITQDMMRSNYITNFYKTHSSYEDRQLLSEKMRHSYTTAHLHYFKKDVDTDNQPITKNDLQEQNQKLQNELDMLKTRLQEQKTGIQDAKKFAKQRYDCIYALNNKGVKPRKASIDKYKLVYDEETKLWV